MRNVWTIAQREFRHYFVSPIAYAVALFLFVVLGILFYSNISFGMQGGTFTPDGRLVMGPMVTLLLLTVPFLTMRLIAEEAGSGTLELLLTAPIRDWELVLGKWLGAMGFIGLVLALTWIYPIVLHRMTTPGIDQGQLLVAYLGVLLMVGAIAAIGVMVSAFFRNSLAAGFVTLAVILVLWVIGGLAAGSSSGSEVMRYLSFGDHLFDNLFQGVVDLGDVLYFVSLTILALFIGSQAVESRRWR
ncbi:MAG TPA: ABC transporter permease [Anaerolineales bacterium]|nr:ABC transporter permease [Anaerolineales bacterium]